MAERKVHYSGGLQHIAQAHMGYCAVGWPACSLNRNLQRSVHSKQSQVVAEVTCRRCVALMRQGGVEVPFAEQSAHERITAVLVRNGVPLPPAGILGELLAAKWSARDDDWYVLNAAKDWYWLDKRTNTWKYCPTEPM